MFLIIVTHFRAIYKWSEGTWSKFLQLFLKKLPREALLRARGAHLQENSGHPAARTGTYRPRDITYIYKMEGNRQAKTGGAKAQNKSSSPACRKNTFYPSNLVQKRPNLVQPLAISEFFAIIFSCKCPPMGGVSPNVGYPKKNKELSTAAHGVPSGSVGKGTSTYENVSLRQSHRRFHCPQSG